MSDAPHGHPGASAAPKGRPPKKAFAVMFPWTLSYGNMIAPFTAPKHPRPKTAPKHPTPFTAPKHPTPKTAPKHPVGLHCTEAAYRDARAQPPGMRMRAGAGGLMDREVKKKCSIMRINYWERVAHQPKQST
jgi:hypothetical protein